MISVEDENILKENVNEDDSLKPIEAGIEEGENNIQYVGGTEYIEFHGNDSQIQEMMKDWAKYIGEVQNPSKDTPNPFFKSLYAALDSVLNATRPILSKYNFGILQNPVYVPDKGMSVTTILTHGSGAFIVFPSLNIPMGSKVDAQQIVSASTYARRGSLNAILGIYGEIDDDGNYISGKTTPAKKNNSKKTDTVSTELANKRKELLTLCTEVSKTTDKEILFAIVEKHCGNRNPNSAKTVAQCEAAIKDIKSL